LNRLFGSLRWRLFSIYVLLVLVILVSAGLLVYSQIENHMINNRFKQTDELVSWALTHSEPQGSLETDELEQVAEKLSYTPGPDFSFFLLDADGELIRSLGQGNPPYIKLISSPRDLLETDNDTQPATVINRLEGSPNRILTIVWPVRNSSGSGIGFIQGEVRLDEADRALADMRVTLIGGFTLLLLVSSGLLLVMTGAVVSPLVNMAAVSRSVSAGKYDQRIAIPRTRDESYYSITAFNKMLDSIQQNLIREKEIQLNTRQFLADASHELRSPITVIKGFVDVLQRGAKNDPRELSRALEMINLSLGKTTRLINDMLKLSQLDSIDSLNMVKLDLNSVCFSIVSEARIVSEEKSIEFIKGPEVIITGDQHSLEQALWNLLDNSIKCTGPGGEIVVAVDRKDSKAILTVKDNGEGIAAEHLPKIFERFYRVNKNSSGTGLGLSIVKTIVLKHGGSIFVESEPGSGTIFTLTFPLAG